MYPIKSRSKPPFHGWLVPMISTQIDLISHGGRCVLHSSHRDRPPIAPISAKIPWWIDSEAGLNIKA